MSRRCAFCDNAAKLTGEHIWDSWLTEAYAEIGITKFQISDFDAAGQPLRSYDSDEIDKTAKVVCEPCNNQWMNDLTNELKSVADGMILRGREKHLELPDLRVLSRFAFMKAVVLDHLARHRQPFWSTEARHAFRKRRQIPDGVQVWLSCLIESHVHGRVWSGYAQPQNALVGFEFYVFTYVVGCVVLQLIGKRWTLPYRQNLPTFGQNDYWNPVSADIWPLPVATLTWPLPKVMNLRVLAPDFRDRWQFLNLRTRFR